jgi:hypothetical protein
MDALKLAVRWPGFPFFVALLATMSSVGFCHGGHGEHFDGTTMCRWSRTWHGPNSIWRPLRPYYIPRPPDPCQYGGHGCRFAVEVDYFAENTAESENTGIVGFGASPEIPVGLERLGQIPNDVGISTGATTGPPARAGR